jgi:endonuclease-3
MTVQWKSRLTADAEHEENKTQRCSALSASLWWFPPSRVLEGSFLMPRPDEIPDDRAFAAAVHRRLLVAYGEPTWRGHYAPMDELVLTFLSQNTSDLNSGRAFAALKARYPTWQAVLDAPVGELAETIRSGGLSQQKAPRIQAALRRILAERGEFNLDFLADLPVEEAERWLVSFDGVGHKTASIVLLFCFNRAAFPVDTHVGRVTRRLGLAEPRATEEKIKGIWERLAPAAWFYPLHLNLIHHGREVCHARAPACGACVLADLCAYASALSPQP